MTARNEVLTAVSNPTSRSSNSGKETTLIDIATNADRNPAPQPITISAQPRSVVSTSRTNPLIAIAPNANRNPAPQPITISPQPRSVVSTSRTNPPIEAGGSGPSVRS